MIRVSRYDAKTPAGRRFLRLILTENRGRISEEEATVESFLSSAAQRGLKVDLLFGATVDERPITGVLAVESPGRMAMVFLPTEESVVRHEDAVVQLLTILSKECRQHDLIIIQALVEPTSTAQISALARSGFDYLANLVYCERDMQTVPPMRSGEDHLNPLTFVTYADSGDDLFEEVLSATYEHSLDCPRLNGLRSIADVMAAHRSCGQHDPTLWYVARLDSDPAGVILLAPQAHMAAVELVYMGVLPAYRGRGLGEVLLNRAHRTCTEHGFEKIILAVDRKNVYARSLYERWGFKTVGGRDAWIIAFDSETT